MPTAAPTPTPTMNAIPVTMTFWFPVMSHPNPMNNPTATPSPSPSPSASPASSPSPSPSARSPFQSPQPNGFFAHPMQAMMQAFLTSMAASNNSTTPTPSPSPSPSPSQSTTSASPTPNDFMSSIPLPQLLNMFWSMQGMNGQSMDLSAFMQGGGNKPTPSTAKHIIEHLPKHIYHSNHKPIPSTSTCSVCQDDFNEGDEWTQLPCHHPYHTTCIQPWLTEKHTCPSCRYPLETDDTEFNNRVVYPEQRTWKHTPHTTSTSTSTCSMSHIHHTSCQLLSGNTSMLTLSCGHPYHLECLDIAQRVLHSSSSTSTNPQTVVCPMCHAHQAFPVHLSELMRVTTPTTTSISTSTSTPSTSTSPSSSTPISPKTESPKDIDIPFDYPMTSEAPTSSPSLPPTSTPSSVPMSSLHGSAQIEDATDTEMTDA